MVLTTRMITKWINKYESVATICVKLTFRSRNTVEEYYFQCNCCYYMQQPVPTGNIKLISRLKQTQPGCMVKIKLSK